MASRNERKRRAKERRDMLIRAQQEAFRLEAERRKAASIPSLSESYTVKIGGVAGSQKLVERNGKVIVSRGKRKLLSSEPKPFEPLKYDGNDSGRGQLRKKYN